MIGTRKARHRVGGVTLAACAVSLLTSCSGEAETQSETAANAVPTVDVVEIDPERRERVALMAAEWSREPDYTMHFNVLDPSAEPLEDTAAARFDPSAAHSGLPEDEGRELVEAYCTACHSIVLVMQQNMVESGWDATLTRMVTDRGMPEMQPDVRQSIMSYLTAHFGADS